MEWVVFVGLGVWVWLQSQRIEGLSRQIEALEKRLPRAEPQALPTLLLDTPLRPGELEPLLLDTPLPEASNDTEFDLPRSAVAPPPHPRTPPRAPDRRLERWLAENGLAWLGGGAIALGGIFLVTFAARQGWFTAQLRLICALILGAALIGASAWARRVAQKRPPGHPLVAALLAGAGASTFYATVWAAHGLYHFIDWGAAAALLTLCAFILIGLSFLHGQALGALAIIAALLAPPLTSLGAWPVAALTLYICAVSAGALALALFRRWAWTAVAAMLGLYFWFAAAIGAGEVWRALVFLSFASVGGLTTVLRVPEKNETQTALSWTHVHTLGPSMAVCVSSVLLLVAWLAGGGSPTSNANGPAYIAVFHVALAAYAVRARVIMPAVLAVAIGALVLGFAAYLRNRSYLAPLGGEVFPAMLLAAIAIVAAALGARAHHSARTLIAGAGAIGAALLSLLAAATREDWHSLAAWAPLFAGAGVVLAAAWRAERDAANPHADAATDFWAGAGAALLLLGVEAAFAEAARATAHAGAALLLAAGFAWRGWRALRFGALSAAALALAHAFSPALLGAALAATLPLWQALALLGATAALLFGAARLAARRETPSATGEALSAGAVITLLIAGFLALRWIASHGVGAPLDEFTETSLRALALLATGHIVIQRDGQKLSYIGQWRGHVLMAAGLIYALLGPALALNPWWGGAPAAIPGPPLFNAQALAFAAPAAIALATAMRLQANHKQLARLYAIAGGLMALVWLPLEIRHAFHDARMSSAGFLGLEGFVHSMWPLGLVIGGRALNERMPTALRAALDRLLGVAAWPALIIAALGLWLVFNPWWGWAPIADAQPAAFALAAFALAAWLSAKAANIGESRRPDLATISIVACMGHLFVATTLMVRWLFHDLDMSTAPASGVELWSYSAVWALFGAGAFALGLRRGDAILRWGGLAILLATTAYVAFLALTRLTGIAQIGSALGLGIVLMIVAWGARRFGSAPVSIEPPPPSA